MHISYYITNQFCTVNLWPSMYDHLIKHGRITLYTFPGSRVFKPHNIHIQSFPHWTDAGNFNQLLNSTPCTSISEAKRLYPELFL